MFILKSLLLDTGMFLGEYPSWTWFAAILRSAQLVQELFGFWLDPETPKSAQSHIEGSHKRVLYHTKGVNPCRELNNWVLVQKSDKNSQF